VILRKVGRLAFLLSWMLAGVGAEFCGAQAAARTQPALSQSVSQQARPAQPRQAYHLPPDKLAKAIALYRIRSVLDLGGSLWGLAVLWLLLATGAAARLVAWTERGLRRRWLQGLLFFAVFLVILVLANLPLDMAGHIASLHFGISVQGWGGWLVDHGKGLGLTLLVGAPALLLFNWIVRVAPRRFWIWAWIVSLPIMVVSTLVEPLIEPLFDQFEPLSEHYPKLVQELERVVARTGTDIPPDRMFLMKASAKTNGLNAYVTGIGATKRIVVWDTTAGRIPDDEVLFVFGHESGHYVLHHIPEGLAASAVGLFVVFWGCAALARRLVRRFGPRWRVDALSSRAGFVVLLFVFATANFLLEPVSNAVSRYFEHQADVYGQEAIHGIVPDPQKTAVAAFNALGEAALDDPHPNAFIEFWTDSHPSIEERANFAAQYDPWKNDGHGEFFKK
jgi:Zn-dependent protease with chaperone function